MTVTNPKPGNRIEIGNEVEFPEATPDGSRLILASYNIRYAVGSRLISSGLLRTIGYNFPTDRSAAVARNIRTAAEVLSNNSLLPPPDILALQEADKATMRAGGQHVAAQLAAALGMPSVHVVAGLPRGITPKP